MPIAVRTDFQSGFSNLGSKIGGTIGQVGADINTGFKEQRTYNEYKRKFDEATKDKNAFNEVKNIMISEIKENFPDMKAKRMERTIAEITGVRYDDGKGMETLQRGISNLSKLQGMTKKAKESGVKLRDWDPMEILMEDSAKRLFGDYEKMSKDAEVGKAVLETKRVLDEAKPQSMEAAFASLPPEYEKYQEVTDFVKKRYMTEAKQKGLEIQERNAKANEQRAAAASRSKGRDQEFDNVKSSSGLPYVQKKIDSADKAIDPRAFEVLQTAKQMMLQDKTMNAFEAMDAAEQQVPPESDVEQKKESKWYKPGSWEVWDKNKPEPEPFPYEQQRGAAKLTPERRKELQMLVR